MKMGGKKLLFGVAFLLFSQIIQHCNAVCTIKDGKTSLSAEVDETPTTGNINYNQAKYRSELMITGTQLTATLSMQPQDSATINFDPNVYLNLIYINDNPYIQLKDRIDRDGPTADTTDDKPSFQFTLKCLNLATNTEVTRNVRLTIKDINDNQPIFDKTSYDASVSELTPIGTTVLSTIRATDKDVNENSNIDYAIASGPKTASGNDIFGITQPFHGYIILLETLDYESMKKKNDVVYKLNISATDRGNPPKMAYVPLLITVTDGDDQDPAFIYPSCFKVDEHCISPQYDASIKSGILTSNILLYPRPASNPIAAVKLQAKDKDTLNSPLILYVEKTLPPNYEKYFDARKEANSNTWDFSQIQVIPTAMSLQVFVRVEEQTFNRRYATAIINMAVMPQDNSKPFISSGKVGSIYENSQAGTLVLTPALSGPLKIVISDNDLPAGQVVEYDITADSQVFSINPNNYIELKNVVLDYEKTNKYEVPVTVTEKNIANPVSIKDTLTVNVIDINDNPPIFSICPQSATIKEGDYTTQNQLLASVSATDADTGPNGQIVYSLVNDQAGKFIIVRTNEIYAKGIITKSDAGTLVIKAEDSTTPASLRRSNYCSIQVTVTDGSQIQFGQSTYQANVQENKPTQTFVFDLASRLQGTTNIQVGYKFAGTVTDFSIDANGRVTTAKVLDRETKAQYKVTVIAFNKVIPTQTTTTLLTVNVLDLNDNNPKFTQAAFVFRVSETNTLGRIGSVQATDVDLNDQISYSLSTSHPRTYLESSSLNFYADFSGPTNTCEPHTHGFTNTCEPHILWFPVLVTLILTGKCPFEL